MPDVRLKGSHSPYLVTYDGDGIGVVSQYLNGSWYTNQTPSVYRTRREAMDAVVRQHEAHIEREVADR